MPTFVCDSADVDALIQQRRAWGGDRYDEVWEGVYVMSPLASNEHQSLVVKLARVLVEVIEDTGLGRVYPGANVTDREDDWERNYRCPDVVVVLKESGDRCRDIGSALVGGPDFLIEVRSPHDRTLEKLDFYATIGVGELLIVDRDDKSLRLFRLEGRQLLEQPPAEGRLVCRTVGLSFRTLPERRIEVETTAEPRRTWKI